jgi:hypothetical protein
LTYEIPGEKVGAGQKQQNGPVWSIVGQYSSESFPAGKEIGFHVQRFECQLRSGNECFDIIVQSLEVGDEPFGVNGLNFADQFGVLLRISRLGDIEKIDEILGFGIEEKI